MKPPTPADDYSPADLAALPTPPNERYYVIIFGSESTPKVPRFTHSWSTLVTVTADPSGTNPAVKWDTISWMPHTLAIRPWRFRVEPGENLSLETTIREMLKHDEKIVMWGPYEVRHGFATRFGIQKQFLESGRIGYQCTDSVGEAARTGNGCDCIHAITDMDPEFDRKKYPLRYFGISASRHAVEQIITRGVAIEPHVTHDWLIPRLGLDCPAIEREVFREKQRLGQSR